MPKFSCPVCGDPNAYPMWLDPEPPEGCPFDEDWMEGRAPSIRSVDQCAFQMKRARQRAEWRKVAPDCFDADGNMPPGKLCEVLERWTAAGHKEPVVL